MRRDLARAIEHQLQTPNDTEHCLYQPLPGVSVYSCEGGLQRFPMVYEPRICLVARGNKRIFLGTKSYHYDADNYLISSLTVPVEVELEATSSEAFLGLTLDIDRAAVRQLVLEMGADIPRGSATSNDSAMQSCPVSERLHDAVLRLLDTAQDPLAQNILAPAIWREIYFEVLRGPHGAMLLNCVESDVDASRIAPVIHYIGNHFEQKLDIESLATVAHMSPSTLHEQFKHMTGLSPMQYVKNLRLHRAHAKILDGLAINQACFEVGYHSPSQFSREFKRFFGVSPREAARTPLTPITDGSTPA